MELLRYGDLRRLLDALDQVYALSDLERFPGQILPVLRRAIRSEFASYVSELNPSRSRMVFQGDPPDYPIFSTAPEVMAAHMSEHPMVAHCARTQDVRALKFTDFLSLRQLHDLGLYVELRRPLGLEHQMSVLLSPIRPAGVGIAVNRVLGGPDFNERDRQMLDLLRPHILQAYHNAHAVTRLRGDQVALVHGWGRRAGLVSVGPSGHIKLVSDVARRYLTAYFGQRPRAGDRLPEELERWMRSETARRGRADVVPSPRGPLIRHGDRARLVVRLFKDAGGSTLLLEEERPARAEYDALTAFGLTRREVEVLGWVVEGKSNPEIGAILGIRPRTVAKHLERTYAKLGVEGRTSALRMALEVSAPEKI